MLNTGLWISMRFDTILFDHHLHLHLQMFRSDGHFLTEMGGTIFDACFPSDGLRFRRDTTCFFVMAVINIDIAITRVAGKDCCVGIILDKASSRSYICPVAHTIGNFIARPLGVVVQGGLRLHVIGIGGFRIVAEVLAILILERELSFAQYLQRINAVLLIFILHALHIFGKDTILCGNVITTLVHTHDGLRCLTSNDDLVAILQLRCCFHQRIDIAFQRFLQHGHHAGVGNRRIAFRLGNNEYIFCGDTQCCDNRRSAIGFDGHLRWVGTCPHNAFVGSIHRIKRNRQVLRLLFVDGHRLFVQRNRLQRSHCFLRIIDLNLRYKDLLLAFCR